MPSKVSKQRVESPSRNTRSRSPVPGNKRTVPNPVIPSILKTPRTSASNGSRTKKQVNINLGLNTDDATVHNDSSSESGLDEDNIVEDNSVPKAIKKNQGNRLSSLNVAPNGGLSCLSETPSVVFITHYLRYDHLLNSSSDAYIFNNLFAIELRFLKRGMLIPILQHVDNWSRTSVVAIFQVVSVSPLSCQLLTEDDRFPLFASVEEDLFKIFVLNELGVARLNADFITIDTYIKITPVSGSFESLSEFSRGSFNSSSNLRAFPLSSSSKQKMI